jgi:hypothetical protein
VSYYLRIICRSDDSISSREILQFILDGMYLEGNDAVCPSIEAVKSAGDAWTDFGISSGNPRPKIAFTRNVAADMSFRSEISEIREAVLETAVNARTTEVLACLDGAKQLIALDVVIEAITDDDWEMIDSLESHVAKNYDGIIYADGEGFYNSSLTLIYRLNHL